MLGVAVGSICDCRGKHCVQIGRITEHVLFKNLETMLIDFFYCLNWFQIVPISVSNAIHFNMLNLNSTT